MTQQLEWGNQLISLHFQWDERTAVSLGEIVVGETVVGFKHNVPIVDLLVAGSGHWIANDRLVQTSIGANMRYVSHMASIYENDIKRLVISVEDPNTGIRCDVTYELAADAAMFRTFVAVTNKSDEDIHLEQVTSWANEFGSQASDSPDPRAWKLHEADFDWLAEGRWHATATDELFPVLSQQLTQHDPRGEHRVISTGTWSTGKHAPLAFLDSEKLGLVWMFQIEHNGAWRWEIGDNTHDGYMALSGPTRIDHSWHTALSHGEAFTTVPVSVTLGTTFDEAYASLVAYRRAMRTEHAGNFHPRVIFNDYMNTLDGDPTTGKLLPLIASAAEVGAEVFCIDAGWYDDSGDWWPSVGEWEPSTTRFPSGLGEVIDAITSYGMIPGLWLEPEVIGVQSPMAQVLPDSAFFQRNGHRVVEQERYVLDLRDDRARQHLDSVIERLVNDYGIGYFKFDYNVSPGSGTDLYGSSTGEGMLEHNRAYIKWLDALHSRFPEIILENCSSGGMREDFAQTSRFQVQSTSDQQDYRLYPAIASSALMMLLPEQSGNWAYPQPSMNDEEISFNLSTTMLGHFFLSGYLNHMNEKQRGLCKEAITVYTKVVQPIIASSVPFWPLGLPRWTDDVVSVGLKTKQKSLFTVWARNVPESHRNVVLFLPQFTGVEVEISTVFPKRPDFQQWDLQWDKQRGIAMLHVPTGIHAARTFAITKKGGGC